MVNHSSTDEAAATMGGEAGVIDHDDLIAHITAEHLLEHLESSNDVVMQGPPARAPSVPLPSNPTPHLTE